MPKEMGPRKSSAMSQQRHAPLDRQISAGKLKAEGKLRKIRSNDDDDDDDGINMSAEYVDPKTSRKIMQQAQAQREELATTNHDSTSSTSPLSSMKARTPRPRAGLGVNLMVGAQHEENSDEEEEQDGELSLNDDENDNGSYDDEYEVGSDGYIDIAEMSSGLSAAEQSVMASFFGSNTERRTINDMILEKIREKEEADARVREDAKSGGAVSTAAPRLPEKVVTVYTEIGGMLKHYSSGKLPKAFKIIPSLTDWEEVLWLTKPDEWSPHAVYAATRIFASNLNERMAQRFYNLILLGRVRDDIDRNGRLNYHLFSALRKAVYKPAAFFKGVLLPLAAEGGGCTLKEATVVAAVVSRVSIPANHSAVALLKLAELPYSGPTSLFVRVLLNKKYALPHRVVDALVGHFLTFATVSRELPVLWHQSLLVFAQRYKHDITVDQKNRMKHLLKSKFHYQITPEIRRELFQGHSRGENELQFTHMSVE